MPYLCLVVKSLSLVSRVALNQSSTLVYRIQSVLSISNRNARLRSCSIVQIRYYVSRKSMQSFHYNGQSIIQSLGHTSSYSYENKPQIIKIRELWSMSVQHFKCIFFRVFPHLLVINQTS